MLDHSRYLFDPETDVRLPSLFSHDHLRIAIRLVDEACCNCYGVNQYRVDVLVIKYTKDEPTATDSPAVGQKSYYVLVRAEGGYVWGNPQLIDLDFRHTGQMGNSPRYKTVVARSVINWLSHPSQRPSATRRLSKELREAILRRLAEFEKARYDAAREA